MSVTVKFKYEPADSSSPIKANFEDWVSTLNAAEQEEVKQARQKHGSNQHLLEYQKKLTVEYTPETTYIWATAEDADAGIPAVADWDRYQARYLTENNAKLVIERS